MFKNFLCYACLCILFLSSCKKEVATKNNTILNTSSLSKSAATDSSTGIPDTTSRWYGTYSGMFDSYPIIQDDLLIQNGIAQLPYLDRQFSYSSISYDIPAQYNIIGDSVAFEAKVRNPKPTSFSDYDVILQLVGEQDSASVHFVADKDYISYTSYSVGSAVRYSLGELVHYFGAFQTVRLAQKKYYTAVYINDVQVYKFKYGEKNSIGKLKTISILFKGYGSCTETGLRNSYTNKPIMYDKFNTDGQSSAVYYY